MRQPHERLPDLSLRRTLKGFGEGHIFAVVKALVLVQFTYSVVVVVVNLLLAFVDCFFLFSSILDRPILDI